MAGDRARVRGILEALAVCALLLGWVGFLAASAGPVMEISSRTAAGGTPMDAFDAPAVAVADFDRDGRAELVASNENRVVYVLSSQETRVLAELQPPYPPDWTDRTLNDPTVADLDGDGALEIMVVTSAATLCVYEHDRNASGADTLDFDPRWCRRADAYDGAATSAGAGAWVENVTGDGRPEIFMQAQGRGLFAFDADGRTLWSRPDEGGPAGATVADLDACRRPADGAHGRGPCRGDGAKEVLFFSADGLVRAVDAATGAERWTFDAARHAGAGGVPVAGSVADLEGDGAAEVVFTARGAAHLHLFVLHADGSLRWRAQPPWANPESSTHPVLTNVTGGNRLEIVLADHAPSRAGPASVFAYGADGLLLWRTGLDGAGRNEGLGMADLDGDGALEVVAAAAGPRGDGIWLLDAATGRKGAHLDAAGAAVRRPPALGDLDGDGDLDYALPVHRDGDGGAVQVHGTDAPCHAIGGRVNRAPCTPPGSTR